MAVIIERTKGVTLMTNVELHHELDKKSGEIVIRLSAEELQKPGAFFRIDQRPHPVLTWSDHELQA